MHSFRSNRLFCSLVWCEMLCLLFSLGAALESCLKLGLKPQSGQDISLWNVLYSSSLVVDEPDFVQSIQNAALLSNVSVCVLLPLTQ